GLAIGGWLIHLAGAPTRWIVRRSGALFFLTSAANGAFVIIAGLALIAGTPGPHDFARTALPVILTAAAMLPVALLPRILRAPHAGLPAPLVLSGAAPAPAAAALLVYHAIALRVPGLGGLIAYLRLRPRLLHAPHPGPPPSSPDRSLPLPEGAHP